MIVTYWFPISNKLHNEYPLLIKNKAPNFLYTIVLLIYEKKIMFLRKTQTYFCDFLIVILVIFLFVEIAVPGK